MPIQLRNPNAPFPHGGWRFADPHTAKLFDDPMSDLNHLVAKVREHRLANPRIYPEANTEAFDAKAILQEILVQFCADKPQLCEDSSFPGREYPYNPPPEKSRPAEVYREAGKKCVKCQFTEFSREVCVSCGGRTTGYRCLKCGFVN